VFWFFDEKINLPLNSVEIYQKHNVCLQIYEKIPLSHQRFIFGGRGGVWGEFRENIA